MGTYCIQWISTKFRELRLRCDRSPIRDCQLLLDNWTNLVDCLFLCLCCFRGLLTKQMNIIISHQYIKYCCYKNCWNISHLSLMSCLWKFFPSLMLCTLKSDFFDKDSAIWYIIAIRRLTCAWCFNNANADNSHWFYLTIVYIFQYTRCVVFGHQRFRKHIQISRKRGDQLAV
jgi:hypothetical protein